jgi:hypothetical protein
MIFEATGEGHQRWYISLKGMGRFIKSIFILTVIASVVFYVTYHLNTHLSGGKND